MNFTQARSGYNIEEVDEAVMKLQNQIENLKQENSSLSETLNQYTAKIMQLVENTKRLDEERTKESLRLTNFLNQAAQMAEETEQEANIKANEIIESAKHESENLLEKTRQNVEKISNDVHKEVSGILKKADSDAENMRKQAQVDFEEVRNKLKQLNDITKGIRKSNEDYISKASERLKEVNGFVNNALKDIPDELQMFFSSSDSNIVAEDNSSEESYEDFVKNMNLSGQKPKYKKEENDDEF